MRTLAEACSLCIIQVPLSVATFRAESWAIIRVLRSVRLRQVALIWLLSPPLAQATRLPCCDVPTIGHLHMYVALYR